MRDEEDIIGAMIEHHLREGVHRIFVTDNNSIDSSRDIASKYPEVVLSSSDDMTHNQEVHVTRMAREAAMFSPDWIVHMDADEFWCGLQTINNPPEQDAAWVIRTYLHFPVSGIVDDRIAPLRKMRHYADFLGLAPEFKIIHRPNEIIEIKHGNHGCVNDFNIGYCHSVYRHHYPVRSFRQFEKKVVNGTRAMKARGMVCQRWYGWLEEYDKGNLREIYNSMVCSWEVMIASGANLDVLSSMLESYKVAPALVNRIRQEMHAKSQLPNIETWVPRGWGSKLHI